MDELFKGSSTLGGMYKTLNDLMPDDLTKHLDRWQSLLRIESGEIEDSLYLTQTSLIAGNLQLQCFKTWFNLYITPAKIAKWGRGPGSTCP